MKNISQERLLEIERELNSLPIHIMVRQENGKMIVKNTPRVVYVEKGNSDFKNKVGIHSDWYQNNKNQSELSKKAVDTMREQGTGLFKYSELREQVRSEVAQREHTCNHCGRVVQGVRGSNHIKKCPYEPIPMNELRDTSYSAYYLEKNYGVSRQMIGIWRREML